MVAEIRSATEPALPFVRPATPASEPPAPHGEPAPPSRRPRADTAELTCSSAAHGLTLSLREYAALCAEREAHPHDTREICDRYDVHDEAVLHALERLYRLRFQSSPALRSQFEQQRALFLHRLRQP